MDERKPEDYKLIFMHGFSQEEIMRIMRGVKKVVDDPKSVAFCTSTKRNVRWRIKDLIKDVTTEHDYMLKNPPGSTPDQKKP